MVSPKKLYLAVREEYFLESTIRRLGAILDCFVASCSSNKKSGGMLNRIAGYKVKVGSWSAENKFHTEEERKGGRRLGVKTGAIH